MGTLSTIKELNQNNIHKLAQNNLHKLRYNIHKNIAKNFDTEFTFPYNVTYKNIKNPGKNVATDKIVAIIDEVETKIKNSKYKTMKSMVRYVIMEFGQNIIKHGISGNNYIKYHQDNDKIHLTFKNQYKKNIQQERELKKNLKNYNMLNIDELRETSKTQLQNDQFSEKGGAGLGLIEVFRRVKGKNGTINWDFSEGNKKDLSNFKIDVEIPSFKENLQKNKT